MLSFSFSTDWFLSLSNGYYLQAAAILDEEKVEHPQVSKQNEWNKLQHLSVKFKHRHL